MDISKRAKRLQVLRQNDYSDSASFPIDLSLTDSVIGPSPTIVAEFARWNAHGSASQRLAKYARGDGSPLRQAVAIMHNLPEEMILPTRGACHAMEVLFRAFVDQGDLVFAPKLTFPVLLFLGELYHASVQLKEMKDNFHIDADVFLRKRFNSPSLTFICNPNNPTGLVEPTWLLEDIIRDTQGIVVIDEANIEYGGESMIPYVKKYKNLVVLRTFSKAYGIADARIGYCVAHPEVISVLKSVMTPQSISQLSESLACLALRDQAHIKHVVGVMDTERLFLTQNLFHMGFDVVPSISNCFIAKIPETWGTARTLVRALNQEGAHVVDGAYFGLPSYIRIGPKTREINTAFLKILSVLATKSESADTSTMKKRA